MRGRINVSILVPDEVLLHLGSALVHDTKNMDQDVVNTSGAERRMLCATSPAQQPQHLPDDGTTTLNSEGHCGWSNMSNGKTDYGILYHVSRVMWWFHSPHGFVIMFKPRLIPNDPLQYKKQRSTYYLSLCLTSSSKNAIKYLGQQWRVYSLA